ncbi:hypothetical protein JXB01_01490, partial [Candidatus Micrarchaeota archaeon]|nr:hypothetical protein [Candidatus Micrarchaeota archaeon]
MLNEEAFRIIGLTENDSKICLSLISEGFQRIGDMEKTTKLHRRSIYDSINRLEKRGFVVSFLKNNKKYYQLADTKKIVDEINERITELQETV